MMFKVPRYEIYGVTYIMRHQEKYSESLGTVFTIVALLLLLQWVFYGHDDDGDAIVLKLVNCPLCTE